MGGIAGFAGAIGCMEMGSWWPTQGDGYMLLVFAAVFIGGTSVFGGSGRLYGTLIGIAIVGMIEAGIVSSGLSGFWTRAVHGMVICCRGIELRDSLRECRRAYFASGTVEKKVEPLQSH